MTDTPNLTVTRNCNAWWIHGYLDGPVGPYSTKAEAESDMRGLLRFEKYENRKGFVCSEKGKK